MKTKMIILSMLVLLTFTVQMAGGFPQVTATYWTIDNGYRLAFTLNADQYVVPGWGFTIDSSNLASPEGWTGSSMGGKTNWGTNDPDRYLQPGQTLQGFAATFSSLPPQIEYFVVGPGESWGTLIPTPIPEPSSILALAGGIGTLGCMARRRRRKR